VCYVEKSPRILGKVSSSASAVRLLFGEMEKPVVVMVLAKSKMHCSGYLI
jgi:hypothetical protein